MVASDDLLKELAGIEREIDALRDRRHELKLGLRYARVRAHPLRGLFTLMMLRDLERRIDLLRLRYGAVYSGYLRLRRAEAGEARADPPSPAAASLRPPRAPTLRRGSR